MRSYLDELKKNKLKVIYEKIEDKNFKISYEKKLIKKEINKKKLTRFLYLRLRIKTLKKKSYLLKKS